MRQQIIEPGVEILHPIIGQRRAKRAGLVEHALHGSTQKPRLHFGQRQWQAMAGKVLAKQRKGRTFAVNDDTVAIENHGRRYHAGAFKIVTSVSPYLR